MNFEVLQKLKDVLSHLLSVEQNQVKLQLEVDDRLVEFERNRDRLPTPPLLSTPHHRNLQPFRNERDPDEHIVRNIKINAPSFDGTLEPQLFLDWIKEMDRHFKWYIMLEERKVSFTTMKLIGQASQYWANLETLRELRGKHPIGT